MTSTPAATAPPGWYADPYRQAAQRWFDGYQWTAHTNPPVPPAVPMPPAPPAPTVTAGPAVRPLPPRAPVGGEYWLVPVGRSWQAVLAPWAGLMSLFLGLLGPLVIPFAVAAVALAVWALCLPRDPAHPGRGRPAVAIVLAVLAILVGLARAVPSL